MSKIDKAIHTIDKLVCGHIDDISLKSRDVVSQRVLLTLRTYVEHIMFKIYDQGRNLDIEYNNIQNAIGFVKRDHRYNYLKKFHNKLQRVVSHYMPTEEGAERLMLEYYEYLFMIRQKMEQDYNLKLLDNLEKFPLNMDSKLLEYYQKIANEVDKYKGATSKKSERFYIYKIKPFFVNKTIYYEITFSSVNDCGNKAERLIAFSKIPIEPNYACKMNFVDSNIEIMNNKMPIRIINFWEISIRDCEFKNFIKLFTGYDQKAGGTEKMLLCSFMTEYKQNLLDIVLFTDEKFESIKQWLLGKAKNTNFFNVLETCRKIIRGNQKGKNILKYLLFTMNNTIIKNQHSITKNLKLSGLHFQNGVIPFDKMPFAFSPMSHNPPFNILISCFDTEEHKSELLARYVIKNTECNGVLFTELNDIEKYFENIQDLVNEYNSRLWMGHRPSNDLKIDKQQIFIQKYVVDCRYIIDSLKELAGQGIANYTNTVEDWLKEKNNAVDCDEKKRIIKKMFSKSRVAIIYGAAGTGKSTLINHISHLFSGKNKLFLAQTNPAVDNLKRKVNAPGCKFWTISKLLLNQNLAFNYDILIIDECSTVSNFDMKKILAKVSFKLLILVGDTYQIESIRFGNWFDLAKDFIPKTSIAELTATHRTKSKELINLWSSVRKMDGNVREFLTKQNHSNRLNEDIFELRNEDSIILCLNYDGLYGINNINSFLQQTNPAQPIIWGIQKFKVGDPILFNDTARFHPVIYNNMKGKILKVEILSAGNIEERIEFDIELDKIINEQDVANEEFQLLDKITYKTSKNSVIRFSVYRNQDTDEDSIDSRTIIPFQISYAISIHKAQGLEYNSVKIVITNEIDEMITHNIFYTAITRAKSQLKIYWSPEVENKILSLMKPKNIKKDASLLYSINIE